MRRLILLIFAAAATADVCQITSNYRNADAQKNIPLADWKTVDSVYALRDVCIPWCCGFETCEGVLFRANSAGKIQCIPYACPSDGCHLVKSSKPQGVFLFKRMPDPTTVITTTQPPTTTMEPTTTPPPITTRAVTQEAETTAEPAADTTAAQNVPTTPKMAQQAALNAAGFSCIAYLNVILSIAVALYLLR